MTRTAGDGRGLESYQGATGCLFVIGAVLPTLWAIWVVLRIGIANSPLWGQQSADSTYPRDMTELWVTAVILTLTAVAFIVVAVRSPARRRSTLVFTIVTSFAAIVNWAILLLR
jgi:hypothetical protein